MRSIGARIATSRAYYQGWLPLFRRALDIGRTQGWSTLWHKFADHPRTDAPAVATLETRLYSAEHAPASITSGGILIVSHALDNRGAPRMAYDMARALLGEGYRVVVASPSDGAHRQRLTDLGVSVIVDPRLLTEPRRWLGLAANFDRIIANSAACWPLVAELGGSANLYWYFHETEIMQNFARYFPRFLSALPLAKAIWVGSPSAAESLRIWGVEPILLEYGDDDLLLSDGNTEIAQRVARKVTICQFASYEPHKGQDLAVAAMLQASLPGRLEAELHLFGPATDLQFHRLVEKLAGNEPSIMLHAEVPYSEYLQRIRAADIVLVPSRSECFSYVALDALALGKPLICSAGAGISAYLRDRENALVTRSNSSAEITQAMTALLSTPSLRTRVGRAGRQVYEQMFTFAVFRDRLRDALTLPVTGNIQTRAVRGNRTLDSQVLQELRST